MTIQTTVTYFLVVVNSGAALPPSFPLVPEAIEPHFDKVQHENKIMRRIQGFGELQKKKDGTLMRRKRFFF